MIRNPSMLERPVKNERCGRMDGQNKWHPNQRGSLEDDLDDVDG